MSLEYRLERRHKPSIDDILYLLENPYSDLAWYRIFGEDMRTKWCCVVVELRESRNTKEVEYLAWSQ